MGRVVVGVDLSKGSARALRWAVSLVGADRVVAVHVVAPVVPAAGPTLEALIFPDAEDVLAAARDETREWLDRTLPDAAGQMKLEMAEGAPTEQLLVHAEGADLLVLGSRGFGGFRGLLLGSVSRQCLAHAPCPVAVVPPEGDLGVPGDVVVGVDGSPESRAALRWALELSDDVGGQLTLFTVVSASFELPVPELDGTGEPFVDAEQLVDEGAELLDRVAGEVLGARADEVRCEVSVGPVVHELLERAVDADLLVVGSRGLGGFHRLMLGSVSHQCATHAPCPVVVVRGGEGPSEAGSG